ncbi:hypothetical protein A2U01_0057976, partial [Trifolium medium]|nr:hypothetical protein [Trifolium medium]
MGAGGIVRNDEGDSVDDFSHYKVAGDALPAEYVLSRLVLNFVATK